MHIGLFCPTINVYGGGEFVAFTMANSLAESGHEVNLFTSQEISQTEIKKFFGKRLNLSIKVIVKPTSIPAKGILSFYQSILRSHDFKKKCDLWIDAYTNCLFPWTNICYVHFPFLNHLRFKKQFPYFKCSPLPQVAYAPYVFFEKKRAQTKGKLLVANSQYTADEIKRFSDKKAEVLYPPVSSTFFAGNTRDMLSNKREDLVVTISRFSVGKGLENIPNIANLIDENIKFTIMGRIHYEHVLVELRKVLNTLSLAEKVKILTDVSKPNLQANLKRAKIYLHTMVGEGFGISIVEAMAMGCIPIVHNSGGPREFVPKEYRYETNLEAVEKIKKGIHDWSPSKALEMRNIAKEFNEENFCKRFISLFRNYTQNRI